MGMIDKMREFVSNFCKSEEVKKEVGSTEQMQKWLGSFNIENIPFEAINELFELLDVAEDKNKIALMDLIRLLLMNERTASYIVNRFWEKFEISIFGYLQCLDMKDAEAKVL